MVTSVQKHMKCFLQWLFLVALVAVTSAGGALLIDSLSNHRSAYEAPTAIYDDGTYTYTPYRFVELKEGEPAPQLCLANIQNDEVFDLARFRGKQPVLLIFGSFT